MVSNSSQTLYQVGRARMAWKLHTAAARAFWNRFELSGRALRGSFGSLLRTRRRFNPAVSNDYFRSTKMIFKFAYY